MGKNRLIANQALQIQELEENLADVLAALGKIKGIIVCVGGPLNDNKQQFTAEQLSIFNKIVRFAEDTAYTGKD